nr:cytochrome c peroxidase [uncultured Roseateles sp.]
MPRLLPTTTRGTLLSLGLIVLMSALLSAALVGCGGGGTDAAAPTAEAEAQRPPPPPAPPPAPLANLASVGDKLFHDRSLSASGRLACASCHAAERAHADPAGSFLPLGGANLDKQGLRSSPSLRYLDQVGPFRIDAQGNAQGGLFWDGRADNRAAQARGPLFNASEMANESVASLVTKLRATPYFNELLRAAALPGSAGDEQLLQASLRALADYQAQDAEFHAYTAKFDAVQDGRAQFTPQEARGLAVFNDPQRGNCAQCHSSRPAPNAGLGARAQFSNHSYFALGAPRNQSRPRPIRPSSTWACAARSAAIWWRKPRNAASSACRACAMWR